MNKKEIDNLIDAVLKCKDLSDQHKKELIKLVNKENPDLKGFTELLLLLLRIGKDVYDLFI